jgi:integrase/recombinase XerD
MYLPDMIRKTALRRGLRNKTIKTYNHCIERFFSICKKDPKEVCKTDIKDYLDWLIGKGACGNTINVQLNSLKFLYEDVLGKKLTVKIRFSKTPRRIPEMLTKEETLNLFGSIENKKHLLMISLMYSAGLRVGELVNLKVKDLEIERGYGYVRDGKGGKDRIFVIAVKLKKELSEHITLNGLGVDNYLFKGQKNRHISTQTIRAIIKKATKKAGIYKNIHPHTMRHSFSTHIIENGYDLMSLQSLLGHKSPETTITYVHSCVKKMISVKSPYDTLDDRTDNP